MNKIVKYILIDILRNKVVIAYTLLLLVISFSVFSLEDNPAKGVVSLLNVVLIIVPLVSIIFSTIYIYNSSEFIELLVSQPLRRNRLWLSLFTGLALAVSLAFLVGCGIPVLLFAPAEIGNTLILMGLILSVVFVAIAMLAAVLTRDKAKGIGASILLWFYFALIFDGVILFLLFQFIEYPMETPIIVFSLLNPIDLARILILLKLDLSVLMGATSAVFKDFFGSTGGILLTIAVLLFWVFMPLWLSLRRFNRRDL